MTSLHDAVGKPVIRRDSAEELGAVRHFAIDASGRRVIALVATSGRTNHVVDWAEVQSIGPDAVIVEGSREPGSEDERAVSGALDPLERRVLSDLGNDLGTATDVDIDDAGAIQSLLVADQRIEGARLRGIGSYAVVVAADPAEA